MHGVGVYFVWPLSSAALAASLMNAGVSKSGSPAPKPTTSMPAFFMAPALALTARVIESATSFIRSARANIGWFLREKVAKAYGWGRGKASSARAAEWVGRLTFDVLRWTFGVRCSSSASDANAEHRTPNAEHRNGEDQGNGTWLVVRRYAIRSAISASLNPFISPSGIMDRSLLRTLSTSDFWTMTVPVSVATL